MKRWLPAVLLGTCLLATGCASIRNDGTPDWVAGKSARYPDSRYLVGRGQAADQQDARNRARADLAQIFETSVKVETSDVTRFSTSGNEGDKRRAESQVSRNIVTRTDQIVQGIQIAELWRDPKTGAHHALAVLPRQQAATALRQEIERLDGATRGYVEQARNMQDLLLRTAAADRALESQAARDAIQKTLRVVDLTGRGVEPEFNSGKLAADLDSLLKRVRVKPQTLAGEDPDLEAMLSGGLSAAGFAPAPEGEASYVLAGSLRLDDMGLIEGWYWTRGVLEVRLVEVTSGKVRGTRRWEVKGSARDKATARRRALDEANAILKRRLRATILGFATGERGL